MRRRRNPNNMVIALCAALLGPWAIAASGCGGGGARSPERPPTWLEMESEARGEKLISMLGRGERFIHLSRAKIRFIELPAEPPGTEARNPDEAVVFVHGFSGTLGDFAPVILAFEGKERLVAFDLPGFGSSLRDDENYSVDAYAECLAELLERLEVSGAHLVCHSLGGQVCIAAALSRHPSIRTLTLVDSAGVYDPSQFVQGISKRVGRVNTGEVTTARGRALFDVAASGGEISKRFLTRDPATVAALSSFSARYRDRVDAISVPTLVIWGAGDPIFNVADAFLLKENVRGAKLHVVDGAGHAPQLTHPHKIAAWIAAHIDAVRRPKGE